MLGVHKKAGGVSTVTEWVRRIQDRLHMVVVNITAMVVKPFALQRIVLQVGLNFASSSAGLYIQIVYIVWQANVSFPLVGFRSIIIFRSADLL